MIAVYDAALRAAGECREGKGPVLLELLTYRRTGHSRRDACHYQAKSEREAWFARDPIERLAARLLTRPDIGAGDLAALREAVERRIEEAVVKARTAPQPTLAELTTDVLA